MSEEPIPVTDFAELEKRIHKLGLKPTISSRLADRVEKMGGSTRLVARLKGEELPPLRGGQTRRNKTIVHFTAAAIAVTGSFVDVPK